MLLLFRNGWNYFIENAGEGAGAPGPLRGYPHPKTVNHAKPMKKVRKTRQVGRLVEELAIHHR